MIEDADNDILQLMQSTFARSTVSRCTLQESSMHSASFGEHLQKRLVEGHTTSVQYNRTAFWCTQKNVQLQKLLYKATILRNKKAASIDSDALGA